MCSEKSTSEKQVLCSKVKVVPVKKHACTGALTSRLVSDARIPFHPVLARETCVSPSQKSPGILCLFLRVTVPRELVYAI